MFDRAHSPFTKSPAHRKVRALSIVLMTIMVVVGVVGSLGLLRVRGGIEQLIDERVPAQTALLTTQIELERASGALERAISENDEETRSVTLAEHDRSVTKARGAWDDFTTVIGHQRRGLREAAGFEVMRAAWLESVATVKSDLMMRTSVATPPPRAIEATNNRIALARRQYAVMIEQIDAVLAGVYAPAIESGGPQVVHDVTNTTVMLISVAGLGLLIGLIVSRLSVRAAYAQHLELQAREEAQQADAARTAHETRLARSLEFARTEGSALDTVSRALRELFPDRTTELLLADSSRAHLRQVITTDGDGVNGCTVGTPHDCPAVTKGHGLQFESSEGYDVCPHLRDRGVAPCSAVCVPVAINGTATGVLHSIGIQHAHMDRDAVAQLELIAGRAGDRIGVLRAFNRSEAQAATDPLTGLLNRRSFEDDVKALSITGTRFAIAYGDLDQFKAINDRHGHPTGDRVLRVFSRAVRECLRPGDLAARWGGEEFVLAFPDTPLAAAMRALERIRQSLGEMVESGLLPPLTVSFGACDWSHGADIDTLIAIADECLLRAKRDGRDRIVTPQTQPHTTAARP